MVARETPWLGLRLFILVPKAALYTFYVSYKPVSMIMVIFAMNIGNEKNGTKRWH
jgi:hypothetical protein